MDTFIKISLVILAIQIIVVTYKYFKKRNSSNIKNVEKRKFKNFGVDEKTMERLILHELQRKPDITRDTAIQWAINRLIRDNR